MLVILNMFTNINKRFLRTFFIFAINSVIVPVFANLDSAPNYMDNSTCLLNPYKGCQIGTWTSSNTYSLNMTSNSMHGASITGGTLRLHWPSSSDYSQLMNKNGTIPNYPAWTPIGNGYMFQIKDDGRVTASLEVFNKENHNDRKTIQCTGTLRLGTNYYRSHIPDNNGLTCKLDTPYFPYKLVLHSENIAGVLAMRSENADDRLVRWPGPTLEILSDGWGSWLHGQGDNWRSERIQQRIMYPSSVKLNDRICKVTTPNSIISFGEIPSSSVGKVSEKSMALKVVCQGYTDKEGFKRSGLGVKNKLIGVQVTSLSQYRPGDTQHTTIGLKTQNNLREDLYVEGSFTANQDCRVAPLRTDSTLNYFQQPIHVAQQDPQHVPTDQEPVIHWRLCADPTQGQSLKAGAFEGQAAVAVEYE